MSNCQIDLSQSGYVVLRPSLVDVVEMGGNLEFTASVVETTTCIDVNGSVKKKGNTTRLVMK